MVFLLITDCSSLQLGRTIQPTNVTGLGPAPRRAARTAVAPSGSPPPGFVPSSLPVPPKTKYHASPCSELRSVELVSATPGDPDYIHSVHHNVDEIARS